MLVYHNIEIGNIPWEVVYNSHDSDNKEPEAAYVDPHIERAAKVILQIGIYMNKLKQAMSARA